MHSQGTSVLMVLLTLLYQLYRIVGIKEHHHVT
jgi:hypothetical protein